LVAEGHSLVNLASSNSKAFFSERFIRTLRQLLAVKRETLDLEMKDNSDWTSMLDEVLKVYNSTPHQSLRFKTPEQYINLEASTIEVNSKKSTLTKSQFQDYNKDEGKFKVGDCVRVTKTKNNVFSKGSESFKISLEIFRVQSVKPPIGNYSKLSLYRLKDLDGKLIKGLFREDELVSIDKSSRHHPDNSKFKKTVAKVLSTRLVKGREMFKVTFNGKLLLSVINKELY